MGSWQIHLSLHHTGLPWKFLEIPAWCLDGYRLHLYLALLPWLTITQRWCLKKMLLPITILCQVVHLIVRFCHIWTFEMTKAIDRPNCINEIGTFQSEDVTHSRASVRSRPSQAIIQRLHHPKSKLAAFWVSIVNLGTFREITEECSSVDICCIQETRSIGESDWLVSGKAAEYRLLWIGNENGLGGVGKLLVKKRVKKLAG